MFVLQHGQASCATVVNLRSILLTSEAGLESATAMPQGSERVVILQLIQQACKQGGSLPCSSSLILTYSN